MHRNILKTTVITGFIFFLITQSARAMEQILDGIEEQIKSDCVELKFNKSDTRESLNNPDDIFLKPNLKLRTIVAKESGGVWTMVTKRYSGDNPLCTIKLTCDQQLESAEHDAINQSLTRIAYEHNRATKKSKTSPYLYLSIITCNKNTQTFGLVGLLKS